MRRWVMSLTSSVAVVAGVGLTAPALAATPSPAPSAAPGGVAVVPDANSRHLSAAGTSLRITTPLRPGQGFDDEVFVVNTTAAPATVAIYPADGIPADGGGYGFASRTERQTHVGAWLQLSATQVTVPANGRTPVALQLVVPATAENGDHVGAVVTQPLTASGSGAIRTVTRYAMPVRLTVVGGVTPVSPQPGPAQAGTAPPLDAVQVISLPPIVKGSQVCPVVRVGNGGGVPINPRAEVTSGGWFGGSSASGGPLGVVGPAVSRIFTLPCVARPIGPGKLQVQVHTAQGDGVTSAHLLWLPPPLLVALLLLLLLIAGLLESLRRGLVDLPGHHTATR
jgi:hypothetical protein